MAKGYLSLPGLGLSGSEPKALNRPCIDFLLRAGGDRALGPHSETIDPCVLDRKPKVNGNQAVISCHGLT